MIWGFGLSRIFELCTRVRKKVEWNFFASERTGRIGGPEWLLDALQAGGVTIVIHFPR